MVNAEGEWVIAEPDNASWDQYQTKAKISAAAQESASLGRRDLQERGLECSIDKSLFVDPTRTPCCQTTYCHDCITNALLENDLRCPKCSTDNILIDSLTPDNEVISKIEKYEQEKAIHEPRKAVSQSPVVEESVSHGQFKRLFSSSVEASTDSINALDTIIKTTTRKRPAENELKSNRSPLRPTESLNQKSTNKSNGEFLIEHQKANSDVSFPYQMPLLGNDSHLTQGMNTMTSVNTNSYFGVPMTFGPQIALDPAMLNTTISAGSFLGAGDISWESAWGTRPMHPPADMIYGRYQGPTWNNGAYDQQNSHYLIANDFTGTQSNDHSVGSFSNQQRNTFSAPTINEEDSAYFRKPVNPHRHQARRNINRPTDYREI